MVLRGATPARSVAGKIREDGQPGARIESSWYCGYSKRYLLCCSAET